MAPHASTVLTPDVAPAERKWDDQTRQRVVKMYLAGIKGKDITAETGVPGSTIWRIVEEAGVSPQRMTRRKTTPRTTDEQVRTLEYLTTTMIAQGHELVQAKMKIDELEAENSRLLALLAEHGISGRQERRQRSRKT